jgi:hypothetical protein
LRHIPSANVGPLATTKTEKCGRGMACDTENMSESDAGPAPQPIKEWPGLFQIFTEADGSRRVELDPQLSLRKQMLEWKYDPQDPKAFHLAMSLWALLFVEGLIEQEPPAIPEPTISNFPAIWAAARDVRGVAFILQRLTRNLRAGCEPMISEILNGTDKERAKAIKSLKKVFREAVDAISLRIQRRAHGGAVTVTDKLTNGTRADLTLPWLTIEITRQIVAEIGDLPTKQQVQKHIEKRYKRARGLSGKTWTDAWKEAGLDGLPHEKPKTRRRGVRVDSKVKG